MTKEKQGEAATIGESYNKMLLNVHVSTSETTQHIIEMPSSSAEALTIIKFLVKIISAALQGKIGYLYLWNPSIVYNASQIVFIEFNFVGPEEWKEIIAKSFKEPLGFKMEKR
jgi:hypothetical protein